MRVRIRFFSAQRRRFKESRYHERAMKTGSASMSCARAAARFARRAIQIDDGSHAKGATDGNSVGCRRMSSGCDARAQRRDGRFPTEDAVQRARLCLSCHLGNRDRLVTHRLMGAGHPRLSFELDTFTTVEPAHFKTDSDYAKRKRLWDGVQVWAIGQAIAVSQTLELLTDPKIGRDGFFPSSCSSIATRVIDR